MRVSGPQTAPSADLVESISYTSTNPFFRTTEFRTLLMEYREKGCFAAKPKRPPRPKLIREAEAVRREYARSQYKVR